MKKEKSIWVLDPTPPGFPAAVTTGAGVSPTAPRPCGGAPLHVGPSGLGFQRAPCGLLQSAGSAPSAGLESFPFPWLPGGRERAGAIKRTSRVEEEKKKMNEEWQMKKRREMVYKEELWQWWWVHEKEWQRDGAGGNICSTGSCTDSIMLALSFSIRDNGQVCSRQIASNTPALTGICRDFAAAQSLII